MIKVLTSGLYTSLQDLGRYGFRKYGVPISGAMDSHSALLAHQLVGNEPEEALIEMTLKGPILQFENDCTIALTGAHLSPTLNGLSLELNHTIQIAAGDELRFGEPRYGSRSYLAVSGGIQCETQLGSCSQYRGITAKMKLHKGDEIQLMPNAVSAVVTRTPIAINRDHFSAQELNVFPGPEFEVLPLPIQKKLAHLPLMILPQSNRMAYSLQCNETLSGQEILSAPVQPGTVQLTPSGSLIVLMRDAQTTGGYARILQLTEQAIDQLAQKRPSDQIYLKLQI